LLLELEDVKENAIELVC